MSVLEHVSALVTSSARARDPLERLRHPEERAAFVLCVLSNAAVITFAIWVVTAGTSWLGEHQVLARRLDLLRTILIASIFALPATALGRNMRFASARAAGLRVSEKQLPELYRWYVEACRKIGLAYVPDLYISHDLEGPAVSAPISIWGGQSVVVLSSELLAARYTDGFDWVTYAVAWSLGGIKLNHTRWWVELLTIYARSIPGIRTPLLVRWVLSRDRCAAFLAPEGVRGLIVEAAGRDAMPNINVHAFVEQAKQHRVNVFEHLSDMRTGRPALVSRAQALYAAGYFDLEHDLERYKESYKEKGLAK